jgi:hypothetical protein
MDAPALPVIKEWSATPLSSRRNREAKEKMRWIRALLEGKTPIEIKLVGA